jgi:hypothetical protein
MTSSAPLPDAIVAHLAMAQAFGGTPTDEGKVLMAPIRHRMKYYMLASAYLHGDVDEVEGKEEKGRIYTLRGRFPPDDADSVNKLAAELEALTNSEESRRTMMPLVNEAIALKRGTGPTVFPSGFQTPGALNDDTASREHFGNPDTAKSSKWKIK